MLLQRTGRYLFCTLSLFLAGHVQASDLPLKYLPGLGEVYYHELKSASLERSFHLYVRLPRPYSDDNDKPLPTIYLLDGGANFPAIAGQYHYLSLLEEAPEMIIVGIAYSGATLEEGNMRSTDFTAASDERDHWGGAGAFQAVLSDELMPLIESLYRSDPDKRMIFGQSLGGQFVLYNALTRPELFYGHIASNPALHRNLEFFLQPHWQAQPGGKQTRLFVSSGEFDAARFREPAGQWIEHWTQAPEKPWALEVRQLPGHTHVSPITESFTQGLRWILEIEINPPGVTP